MSQYATKERDAMLDIIKWILIILDGEWDA